MKKINLIWIIELLILPLLAFAVPMQTINDSNIYLSADLEREGSGFVNIQLIQKINIGSIDVAFGFDVERTNPEYLEVFVNNYTQNLGNGTILNIYNWTRINPTSTINYDYDGKNKWFLFQNLNLIVNKTYSARMYLNVLENGKYDIAIKRNIDSIATAISTDRFYFLDPYFNLSNFSQMYYNFNENIIEQFYKIKNGTSTGLTYNLTTYPIYNASGDGGNASGRFDGSTTFMNTTNSFTFDNFSISLWFKKQVASGYPSSGDAQLFGVQGGAGSSTTPTIEFGFNSGVNADKIWFYMDTPTGQWKQCYSTSTITNTNWHHIVATRKGMALEVWLDGQNYTLSCTQGGTMGVASFNKALYIGAFNGGSTTSYFNGHIDEVKIFNKTLNSSEITNLYETNNVFTPPNFYLALFFHNQIPPIITETNLFENDLNISFNYTSSSNLTETYLFYNITRNDNMPCIFVNGTNMCGPKLNESVLYYENNKTYFSLEGDHIYPATYNIFHETMEDTPHSNNTLANNEWISIEFINVSNMQNSSFLEMMIINQSSSNQPVYYCNSSYDSGNPETNGNCALFFTLTPRPYNHTHSNHSSHQVIPLSISVQKVGNVFVTQRSQFLIKGGMSWVYSYINNLTRENATRFSNNGGNTWTSQSYTIDAHLHQFSGSDVLRYYACSNNTDGVYNCSSVINNTFGLVAFPPSSPQVISPIAGIYANQMIFINYTASTSATTNISYYKIELWNATNSEFYTVVQANNALNLTFRMNSTFFENAQYFIRVFAFDINGLSSFGDSESFQISNAAPIVPISTADAIERFTNHFFFVACIFLSAILYGIHLFLLFAFSKKGDRAGSTILQLFSLMFLGFSMWFAPTVAIFGALLFMFLILLFILGIDFIFRMGGFDKIGKF